MNQSIWDKAVAFHGHECPGLAIGVRVAEAARDRIKITRALDEEIACITENDACGVDAIQCLLGCTIGKGNLIYKATGKMAFTLINRASGEAVRFYFKGKRGAMSLDAYKDYILSAPLGELFNSRPMDGEYPEKAKSFESIACESCGEEAPENMVRIQGGKKVCMDCCHAYSRGW
ncbi:MAG: FmdE family protein [Eubacteriaceae bacterium]|jgi:formylmethanofuran dehydrogenase subunit E|nr:FmdE family protein [Eubacteriaceae bacterium]